MKNTHRISVMMVVTVALLAFSMPLCASKTDDRIESTAKASYVFKTFLKGDDIEVQSRDGAVTLTGSVADNHNKSLAQETVAGLPGVKSVDNRLTVKATPDPAESPDLWLMTKVKGTLLFHRNVSGFKTEVHVKDGIVTLQGEAPSRAQKYLAEEYARDVEGVRAVNNEMTVAKASAEERTIGEKIDDASITAQVKLALLYHRSTSALNTSVKTEDGVVTLSGKAKNTAEMDLAAKIASEVNGVEVVKNRMTIE
ncbi:MAG: BON domain-containing protein [Syntrophales bacterium]|nr:BON domain-containing protein [Syntrophales bacterium]